MKIVIPFSDTNKYRRQVLGYVISRYNTNGYDVIVGEIPHDEPWSKGRAVRAGIKDLPDDELIAVADADCWLTGLLMWPQEAPHGSSWAVPHRRVLRLSQGYTAALMANEDGWPEEYDRAPYVGIAGGGIVLLTVGQYKECPIDPRFIGWGSEDHAWGYALLGMYGKPYRGNLDLVHFWHPEDPHKGYGKLGSDSNNNLRKKYFQAISRPDVLRSLIAEGQAY